MPLLAGPRAACRVLALPIVALLTLALLIPPTPSAAAPGECRHIESRKERNACYEQQEAAPKKRAKAPSVNAGMDAAMDQLKLENDQLNRRLQGICRGC